MILLSLLSLLNTVNTTNAQYPDILTIVIDDLGYRDWTKYDTPNFQKFMNSGLVFTHGLHPHSMCTPNRAALITGRYPLRYGMAHSAFPFRIFTSPYHPNGLPLYEKTIPTVLKNTLNYSTHLVGKWHLGIGDKCKYCPTNHGFDSFYGIPVTNSDMCGDKKIKKIDIIIFIFNQYVNDSLTVKIIYIVVFLRIILRNYLNIWRILIIAHLMLLFRYSLLNKDNCILMSNDTIIERPFVLDTLTFRLMDRAIDIINTTNSNSPLYLHFAPDKVHTAIKPHPSFVGRSGISLYADAVMEVDYVIGKVVEAMEKRNRPLLIFMLSDNGGHVEDTLYGGDNTPLKGSKGTSYNGGVQTMIFMKYNNISNIIDTPVSTMDIFPTILNIVGISLDTKLDGMDLFTTTENRTFVHYCGTRLQAISMGQHKAYYERQKLETDHSCPSSKICICKGHKYEKPMIFNIVRDPHEKNEIGNLIGFDFDGARKDHINSIAYHPNIMAKSPNPFIFINKV